jgi:hypothetical protein
VNKTRYSEGETCLEDGREKHKGHPKFLIEIRNPRTHQHTSSMRTPSLQVHTKESILKPVGEPGYFVASWWRTPLRLPQKLLLTNRFYFQQTSGIHAPVGKRKNCSLSGRIPAPIAESSNVATIARKHSVLNLREIYRNNTHTALASVLTFYGRVSLIF